MNNGGRMESARYQAIVEVQRIARCRLKERIDALAASERPPLVGYGRALAELLGEDEPRAPEGILRHPAFWAAVLDSQSAYTQILLAAADVFLAQGAVPWCTAVLLLTTLGPEAHRAQARFDELQHVEDQAHGDIRRGIELHDQGHFAEAIAVFDEVIQRHRCSGWARYEKALSIITLDRGRYLSESKELIRETLRREPFFERAYAPERGPDASLFREAISPFLKSTERGRSQRFRFAFGLQRINLLGLAAVTWHGLLIEDPRHGEIRWHLARCLREMGLSELLSASGLQEPQAHDGGVDQRVAHDELRSLRETVNRLAQVADYEGVLRAAQAALSLATSIFGAESLEASGPLLDQGRAQLALGRLEVALPLIRRALEIRAGALGPANREVAACLSTLALAEAKSGQLAEAEAHLQQAIHIWEQTDVPDHPEHVAALNNLGNLMSEQGRYPEARLTLRRALHAVTDRGTAGALLVTAGWIEFYLGNIEDAQRAVREAEPLLAATRGPAQTSMLSLQALQADLFRAKGEPDRAITKLQDLLAVQRSAPGEEHQGAAATLCSLAMLHLGQGRVEVCEAMLLDALDLRARSLGPRHDDAPTLRCLGVLRARQGRFAEAAECFARALDLHRTRLGEHHPLVAEMLYDLGRTEAALGKDEQALARMREAFALDSLNLANMAPGRTDRERMTLTRHVGERFAMFLSLVLDRLQHSPSAVRAAAGCILARKVLLADLVSERVPDVGEGRPLAAPDLELRKNLLGRLASLALGGPRTSEAEAYQQELEHIAETLRALQMSIGPGGSRAGDPARDPDALLEAVQSCLGDRVLVEFVLLDASPGPLEPAEKGVPEGHYVALLLGRAEGQIHLLDLGPAERIDKLVRRYRVLMEKASELVVSNEGPAEAQLRMTSRLLYDAIFAPLRPFLDEGACLVIAPDGRLHLVPLETIVEPGGAYLIERFEFDYIASGRDLLMNSLPASLGGEVCVFVDPDFDLSPPHLFPTGEVAHHGPLSEHIAGIRWSPLPGTRKEAEAIRAALPQEPIRVFTGAQAGERELKHLSHPRILHLATHGFFVSDQDLAGGRRATGEAEARDEIRFSPMLRSGLAMAGANTITQRRVSGDTDKGIISALEIAALDLRGTELVVLSGCETGIGATLSGEGVIGLRRAFQAAGVQQMISSLWRVPDEESASLFRRFYLRLGSGIRPGEALRAARLEVIEERRAIGGASHPLFWGAFIAMGNPRPMAGLGTRWPAQDGERLTLTLPDGVTVAATAHTLGTAHGPVECCTLVTQGLQEIGQQEMAISFLRRTVPPAGPLLSLIHEVMERARQGLPVAAGHVLTQRPGGGGFLGRLNAAYFAPPQGLDRVPGAEEALTTILLTSEEGALMQEAGAIRPLARLGQQTRFFPTAPWADPERAPLVSRETFEESLLSKLASVHVPGARIALLVRGGRSGLDVEMEKGAEGPILRALDEHPELLAVLGGHDPAADAILVWRGGNACAEAIVPGPPKASRYTANFIALVRTGEDEVHLREDGAFVTLTEPTWKRILDALRTSTSITVPTSGDCQVLRLSWLAPEVASADGSMALRGIRLVTPENVLAEALTAGELANTVRRVQAALALVPEGLSGQGADLFIALTLQPSAPPQFDCKVRGVVPAEIQERVQRGLGMVDWPLLLGGEVRVVLAFALWGGAGPGT